MSQNTPSASKAEQVDLKCSSLSGEEDRGVSSSQGPPTDLCCRYHLKRTDVTGRKAKHAQLKHLSPL